MSPKRTLNGEKLNARAIKPGLYTASRSLSMPENRNVHVIVWRGIWGIWTTVNVRHSVKHSVKDMKWVSLNDIISYDSAMLVLNPVDIYNDDVYKHLEEQTGMLDDYFLILSHKHGPVFVDILNFHEHPFDKIG
jgi:hypothetical protein